MTVYSIFMFSPVRGEDQEEDEGSEADESMSQEFIVVVGRRCC